ncbi:hypothetical protein [Methanocaldococcus vulcanius]|uniref:hypothetical protein n=1 Tax=Methanocaldococcus vulcanius TaxID=73913 RepID=UPI00064EE597|nr:hypothetical protein [Methanocaldococcus vulcanius]
MVERIRVQCPAKKVYSSNIIKSAGKVKEHPETRRYLSILKNHGFLWIIKRNIKIYLKGGIGVNFYINYFLIAVKE